MDEVDGDEDGGEVDDETATGVQEELTVETTADVENDEYIGLPTIVALLISWDFGFFECLSS